LLLSLSSLLWRLRLLASLLYGLSRMWEAVTLVSVVKKTLILNKICENPRSFDMIDQEGYDYLYNEDKVEDRRLRSR